MSIEFKKIDYEQISDAPSAIMYIDELFEYIRGKIKSHDFDCVLAYLNEKYQIDGL